MAHIVRYYIRKWVITLKILLVSDKEVSYIWDHFDAERFKDVELIISCGDLKAEYLSFLVTMIHVPLFYVPGNHNESYLKKPPEGCVSIDNQLIKYKNISILGLGGSQKYNHGPFQYTDQQMQKRISRLKHKIWWNGGFDILVTHAPAYGLGDGEDLCHQGFKSFNKLLDQYSPRYFFHGHQHLNYSRQSRIIQYKNTTIINAYEYYLLDY
ncbi:MAG: metallophosphoesterase [Clostridia bacterium]|jgi:Icc-related predicted phosphoesterase|nr:metallophosphoesterase [Clostridia bacterium]